MKKPLLTACLVLLLLPPVTAMSFASDRAYVDVRHLETSTHVFRLHYGVFPPEESWWEELTGHPDARINIHGQPFLRDSMKLDPWGSPYQYVLREIDGQPWPGIYSFGPDRRSRTRGNDPDDISSWRDPGEIHVFHHPPFFTAKKNRHRLHPYRLIRPLAVSLASQAEIKFRRPDPAKFAFWLTRNKVLLVAGKLSHLLDVSLEKKGFC